MRKAKKEAARFSGLGTPHGGLQLHIHATHLSPYRPSSTSLKSGGSGIGRNLSYTGGLKIIGSAPLLFSGFFTPLLRSIAYAVVHPITGMLEYRKALDCPMTVRHPHLNGWICKSQIIGGLK